MTVLSRAILIGYENATLRPQRDGGGASGKCHVPQNEDGVLIYRNSKVKRLVAMSLAQRRGHFVFSAERDMTSIRCQLVTSRLTLKYVVDSLNTISAIAPSRYSKLSNDHMFSMLQCNIFGFI